MTSKRAGEFEVLPGGLVRLHFPGREPVVYRSMTAARNRRLWLERNPNSTPGGRRGFGGPCWTPEEEARLEASWKIGPSGRRDWPALQAAFGGRTVSSIKKKASGLLRSRKLEESVVRVAKARGVAWTEEELRIIAMNPRDKAVELLAGTRTEKAVAVKAREMGLKLPNYGDERRWSDKEISLLSSALRSLRKLQTEFGRDLRHIDRMRRILTSRERRFEEVMSAVNAAASALPKDIRVEVVNEVVAQVLGGAVDIPKAKEAVRRAVTKIYGPRHFSLDAPLSDGSGMNWIDTIADDRPHF